MIKVAVGEEFMDKYGPNVVAGLLGLAGGGAIGGLAGGGKGALLGGLTGAGIGGYSGGKYLNEKLQGIRDSAQASADAVENAKGVREGLISMGKSMNEASGRSDLVNLGISGAIFGPSLLHGAAKYGLFGGALKAKALAAAGPGSAAVAAGTKTLLPALALATAAGHVDRLTGGHYSRFMKDKVYSPDGLLGKGTFIGDQVNAVDTDYDQVDKEVAEEYAEKGKKAPAHAGLVPSDTYQRIAMKQQPGLVRLADWLDKNNLGWLNPW